MIKNFIILSFIGKDNKIGLKINKEFYVHSFEKKIDNDQLVCNILNFLKKYKINIDANFSIIVNNGPGSFSSLRTSLAIAKGIKISKNVNMYGYKNTDLGAFDPTNIDLLIKKNLIRKNLIKPIYLS